LGHWWQWAVLMKRTELRTTPLGCNSGRSSGRLWVGTRNETCFPSGVRLLGRPE
jgi:hypothetical protein